MLNYFGLWKGSWGRYGLRYAFFLGGGGDSPCEGSPALKTGHIAPVLTHSGPNEGRGVTDVLQAFVLDEIRHAVGEVLIVGFDIVLQDESTQRTSGLVWMEGIKKGESSRQ